MAVSAPPAGPAPRITLDVAGKELSFLVDTGAARSVLCETAILPSWLTNIHLPCSGLEGVTQHNPVTKPLLITPSTKSRSQFPQLHLPTGVMSQFVVSQTCPFNLLGSDFLQKVWANIQFREDGTVALGTDLCPEETCLLMALTAQPSESPEQGDTLQSILHLIPDTLWAKGPQDIGRLKV